MTETPVVCPQCGAKNPAGAEWCSQCYSRLDAPVVDPREPADEQRMFAHPDSAINYPGRPIFSRSSEGVTSFGRRGRIVATAVVLVIGVALLLASGILPVLGLVWIFIVTPLLLREFWKKTPAGYEKVARQDAGPDDST